MFFKLDQVDLPAKRPFAAPRAAGLFLALLLPAAFLPLSALAEFIPPNEVQVRTEVPRPEFPQNEFGTYTYDIDWQGVPIASAKVAVRESDCPETRCLTVRATARSGRAVDLFYRLRHLSESTFREDTVQPISFVQKQTENSYSREAKISWRADGTVKSHFKKKKDPYDLEFAPNNSMFDPISAAFYAKSVPLEIGTTLEVDVFNGRNRFIITFNVIGREKVEVGEQTVDAFKIVPTVKKLTDTEGEKKFRSAAIWISDDKKREVLKMESEVFIGSVNAELVKFEPEPKYSSAEPAPAESGLAALKSHLETTGRAMLGTPGR